MTTGVAEGENPPGAMMPLQSPEAPLILDFDPDRVSNPSSMVSLSMSYNLRRENTRKL